MLDFETVRYATNQLLEDADFWKLERAFSTFCPFEAMGVVGTEIRHSNFLAYLLNPFRPHGFGTAVLEAFSNSISPQSNDPHVASNLGNAEVRREWRNIDLLIHLPNEKQIIAVELKIDARQSDDQLQRYRKIVETHWPAREGWKHRFIFLTKNHEVPNDDAWTLYRLRDFIELLDRVAASPSYSNAQGVEALRAYIGMMRRHHLGDEALEKIAQTLWAKHGDALAFLVDRRPDPLRAIFDSFGENLGDLITNVEAAGIVLEADRHTNKIIRLAFSSWDELPNFRTSNWTDTKRLILLEVKLENTRISGNLFLGPGSTSDRDTYAQTLLPISPRRSRAGSTPQWLCLADEALINLDAAGEVDCDEALKQCSTRMSEFTKRIFDRFNPTMLSLVEKSLSG